MINRYYGSAKGRAGGTPTFLLVGTDVINIIIGSAVLPQGTKSNDVVKKWCVLLLLLFVIVSYLIIQGYQMGILLSILFVPTYSYIY